MELGERLRDTVKREVREETGFDVEVGAVAGYREGNIGTDRHYIVLAFHCTLIGGDLSAGDDAAEYAWVDPTDVTTLLTTPALEDVFRDAGLLRRAR